MIETSARQIADAVRLTSIEGLVSRTTDEIVRELLETCTDFGYSLRRVVAIDPTDWSAVIEIEEGSRA